MVNYICHNLTVWLFKFITESVRELLYYDILEFVHSKICFRIDEEGPFLLGYKEIYKENKWFFSKIKFP